MTDEEWCAAEESWAHDEQRRANRVRVHGYTLACARRVDLARIELERAVSLLENARSVADKAMRRLNDECDHALEMGRIIALDDDQVTDRVALALEEACG